MEDSRSSGNAVGELPKTLRLTLLSIYVLVLVGGATSLSLIITNLKSNIRSVTTTAVINLIIAHSLFLLTVPFRIYFYATSNWQLGPQFCRFVSAMMHAHIYLTFVFYVIVLVTRYLAYYRHTDRMEFYRRMHAVAASGAVWLVMLVVALPTTVLEYGASGTNHTAVDGYYQCFRYGGELNNVAVAAFNYIVSGIIIVVAIALACCQACILSRVYQTHRRLIFSRQEFWAQAKSLGFVAVMLVCIVPCQVYRLYYVSRLSTAEHQRENINEHIENINELFLALTAFSCMDMLITTRGRWSCCSCCSCCSCVL